jgi:hypothetical protein
LRVPASLVGGLILVGSALGAAAHAGGVRALSHSPLLLPGAGTAVTTAAYVILVLLAVGCVLVIAVGTSILVRRPRRGSDEFRLVPPVVGGRWSRVGALLAALVLVLSVVALAVAALGHTNLTPRPAAVAPGTTQSPPATVSSPPPSIAHARRSSGGAILAVGIATVAIVAAIAVARPRGGSRAPAKVDLTPTPGQTDLEVAREGLEAAALALNRPGTARKAVIDAYVAMTVALEATVPSLTPRGVLDRLVERGIADTTAADALVRLFEKARFSQHVITDQDRTSAQAALTIVRDSVASGSRHHP